MKLPTAFQKIKICQHTATAHFTDLLTFPTEETGKTQEILLTASSYLLKQSNNMHIFKVIITIKTECFY